MNSRKINKLGIPQILSVILIITLFLFISIIFNNDIKHYIETQEEQIFKDLSFQARKVDTRMAEIFDRAKLSKYWLEEVSLSAIKDINLEDYNWAYHKELKVTYLVKDYNHLGSIYINGKYEDMTEAQVNEVKRILATFELQKFIVPNCFAIVNLNHYIEEIFIY
ncbi:hypothetical protein QUF55_08550 [Clostridiaceae bacterium HSG29]|nr:hypothetical protein [Clostridiaceae bacterium HSG29]